MERGKDNLYTKIIGVRQETQTLEHASRITLWYKVDEIILFFNEIRLIIIFSHFLSLMHAHAFFPFIHSFSFLSPFRSRFLTQSFIRAMYDNGYNNNCYCDV